MLLHHNPRRNDGIANFRFLHVFIRQSYFLTVGRYAFDVCGVCGDVADHCAASDPWVESFFKAESKEPYAIQLWQSWMGVV